jgi:hypothetical protein
MLRDAGLRAGGDGNTTMNDAGQLQLSLGMVALAFTSILYSWTF